MSRPAGARIRIVALGDSTTAGTPAFLSPLEAPPRGEGDEKSQYAYWMMKTHNDWEVLNRGVNGERSDQILARFGRDVLSEKPRFAIVLAGMNDIYQGFPVAFTERNLGEIYHNALKAKVTPIGCSVLPYNTLTARDSRMMRELNKWVETKCGELYAPFVDTNRAVADPGDPDRLAGSPDGLHPDVDGYKRMAEVISEAIENQIEGQT